MRILNRFSVASVITETEKRGSEEYGFFRRSDRISKLGKGNLKLV